MDSETQKTQASYSNLGFAKKLASPSKKIRDKAVSLLILWLSSRKEITEMEIRKIWKGLFYCFWHADKLPVQTDLAERLASILENIDSKVALLFFKVFLSTMRSEWGGIDRLRLDKFYLLLRKHLIHMFELLRRTDWDLDRTDDFMGALADKAFLAVDRHPAMGINFHYVDIYLQELGKFLPIKAEVFRRMLEPFFVILSKASDKILLNRVKENVFERLLNAGHSVIKDKQGGGLQIDEDMKGLGSLVIRAPLTSTLFELASSPSTPQFNRKILYELHEGFSKLDARYSASGITVKMPRKKRQKLEAKAAVGTPSSNGSNESAVKQLLPKIGTLPAKLPKIATPPTKSPKIAISPTKSPKMATPPTKSSKIVTPPTKSPKMATPPTKSLKIATPPIKSPKIVTLPAEAADASTTTTTTIASTTSRKKKRQGVAMAKPSPSEQPASRKKRKLKASAETALLDQPSAIDEADCKTPCSREERRRTVGSPSPNGRSANRSNKKVRFSLKKNLVWKPHSPLPPLDVRVPPSATPKGSALKKSPKTPESTKSRAKGSLKGSNGHWNNLCQQWLAETEDGS